MVKSEFNATNKGGKLSALKQLHNMNGTVTLALVLEDICNWVLVKKIPRVNVAMFIVLLMSCL